MHKATIPPWAKYKPNLKMNSFPVLFLLLTLCQCIFSTHPDQRIVNGVTVSAKDFPYQAFVMPWFHNAKTNRMDSNVCGGSLISQRHVLTAAHCVVHTVSCDEAFKIFVYLGSHTINKGIMFSATWTVHKEYYNSCNNKSRKNMGDIALLFLERDVEFSAKIQRILLPSLSDTNEQLEGARALVSGFGLTEIGRTNYLKATNVSIGEKSFCVQHRIPEDHICAEIQNHETDCTGDSGGPVVINNTLYGIVSFGPPNCLNGSFSAYTSVIKYMDWISGNMLSN